MNDLSLQPELPLFPLKEIEINGIQMGILSDGTPYLTATGLARMCGVDQTVISRLGNNWDVEKHKPRGTKINNMLLASNYNSNKLCHRTSSPNGETHAYTDTVCMTILEYYAFESGQANNETAAKNYRSLARLSFKVFIYDQVGYNPDAKIPDAWQNFHDRLLVNNNVPLAYFSIFREMADFALNLIKCGMAYNENTVPDISVGMIWSKYWSSNNYDCIYGERKKHLHTYPENYAQSEAPPIEAWVYPIEALGIFRVWLSEQYCQNNFPKYLNNKQKAGAILPASAQKALQAVRRIDE